MLGILAYFLSVFLLWELMGGFDKGQWIYLVLITIVGVLFEMAAANQGRLD